MRLLAAACATAAPLAALAFTTTALAFTEILPTTINKFTGSNVGSGEWQTLSGDLLSCTKETVEGTVEAKKATGSFTINWPECKSAGIGCSFTAHGAYKVVHDGEKEGHTYAILFEFSPATEFECGPLLKLRLSGSEACLILEPESVKITHEFHCKNSGTGDAQITRYWFEGKEGTALLLLSVNGNPSESTVAVFLGTVRTSVNGTETASQVMG
jgi:hypothetical protein